MKALFSVLGLVLTMSASAQSASLFLIERGNWWVNNTNDGCVAGSRPFVETNVSPFMNLQLLYDGDSRELTMTANFWPDAFEAGEKTTITLSASGQEILLPATATDTFAIVADEPLRLFEPALRLSPEEQPTFRALREASVLTVRAEGLPHALGVYAATTLNSIFRDLRYCATLLKADER